MTKILVPVDRAQGSHTALPVARWLAAQLHTDSIVLLCVGELPETPELGREEENSLDRALVEASDELGEGVVQQRGSKAGIRRAASSTLHG